MSESTTIIKSIHLPSPSKGEGLRVEALLAFKDQMYRLALRITQNSQEAEDVVQDVIIKMWKMRDRLTPDGEVKNIEAFAMKMTRNLSIDRQRMHINQTEDIDGMDFPSTSSIEQTIERDERIQSIRDIMKQMPEKLSTAMQLRDFEGHSYKEIAEAMGVTEDNVKIYIFRARQFVKTKITIDS